MKYSFNSYLFLFHYDLKSPKTVSQRWTKRFIWGNMDFTRVTLCEHKYRLGWSAVSVIQSDLLVAWWSASFWTRDPAGCAQTPLAGIFDPSPLLQRFAHAHNCPSTTLLGTGVFSMLQTSVRKFRQLILKWIYPRWQCVLHGPAVMWYSQGNSLTGSCKKPTCMTNTKQAVLVLLLWNLFLLMLLDASPA